MSFMAWEITGAFLMALGFSVIFGRRFVAWLKSRGLEQPLQEDVNNKIYKKNKEGTGEG